LRASCLAGEAPALPSGAGPFNQEISDFNLKSAILYLNWVAGEARSVYSAVKYLPLSGENAQLHVRHRDFVDRIDECCGA
jgi:hypothetical protein